MNQACFGWGLCLVQKGGITGDCLCFCSMRLAFQQEARDDGLA